ncbi:DNA mismatch repair endonuclease MutL [Candidatus Woesearchaeota archaeon]|nr:DNA mismatch repair endonuclease MutL [Candidatus Woesearchaeota archaeon]
MGKIKVLDENLINRIAAGEVIERPASVVKELIENSIDAGAKKILIEACDAGLSMIKVSDDGEGMNSTDAELCMTRHATSKLKSKDGLFRISTLGFRGEALSSIAAVSRTTIRTKTADATEGIEIVSAAGKITNKSSKVCNKGTTITVSDIFFNVPARKKHLKSTQTELSVISDIISRYALANPEIYFQFVHNSKSIITSPSTTNMLSNIASIYGYRITRSLVPVSHSSKSVEVLGYVSRPEFTRGNRSWQSLFLNRRYVKNNMINEAVYKAYHTLLNIGKHPVFVLAVNMGYDSVDVNIHPSKKEVKLSDEAAVQETVYSAVLHALSSARLIRDADAACPRDHGYGELRPVVRDRFRQMTIADHEDCFREKEESFNEKEENKGKGEENKDSKIAAGTAADHPIYSTGPSDDKGSAAGYAAQAKKASKPATKPKARESRQNIDVVGQMHECYILAQTDDGCMLIDQHAAHERILYERFMDQYNKKGVSKQELIKTIILDFSPEEDLIVKGNIGLLGKMGFGLESFGMHSYILRTVPLIFGRMQFHDVLQMVINELKSEKTTTLDTVKEERIIRKSCRAAIKANERLEQSQMTTLLQELFSCKNPYTCPHGRPTMVRLTKYDIEKMFKRRL